MLRLFFFVSDLEIVVHEPKRPCYRSSLRPSRYFLCFGNNSVWVILLVNSLDRQKVHRAIVIKERYIDLATCSLIALDSNQIYASCDTLLLRIAYWKRVYKYINC